MEKARQEEIDQMIDAIDLSMQEPEVEPYRQYYFIKKCRQMIAQLTDKLGRRPTANVR